MFFPTHRLLALVSIATKLFLRQSFGCFSLKQAFWWKTLYLAFISKGDSFLGDISDSFPIMNFSDSRVYAVLVRRILEQLTLDAAPYPLDVRGRLYRSTSKSCGAVFCSRANTAQPASGLHWSLTLKPEAWRRFEFCLQTFERGV